MIQRNSQGEHSDSILTQWEKELEILENWLNHPNIGEDYHRNSIMKDSTGNLQESKSHEEIKKKEKQPMGSSNKKRQQKQTTKKLLGEQERVVAKEPSRG